MCLCGWRGPLGGQTPAPGLCAGVETACPRVGSRAAGATPGEALKEPLWPQASRAPQPESRRKGGQGLVPPGRPGPQGPQGGTELPSPPVPARPRTQTSGNPTQPSRASVRCTAPAPQPQRASQPPKVQPWQGGRAHGLSCSTLYDSGLQQAPEAGGRG